jgi:D-threo-aldose 1-dehydrogenase
MNSTNVPLVMSAMRRRLRDALAVPGFGGAPIGNLGTEVSSEDARAAVDEAWRHGVRFFDTAPHYGLGLSETRLGQAMSRHERDAFVLSSKVGRLLEPVPGAPEGWDDQGFAVPAWARRRYDLSRDGVRRCVEESLIRLGTDRLDLALVHDPVGHLDEAVRTGVPALRELQDEGVVGLVGAGMVDAPALAQLMRRTDLDVVMIAGRYTLLEQPALSEVLPTAWERGVDVIVAGVFNSGLLAQQEIPEDATYDYAPAPAEALRGARAWADLCARWDCTLPAVAAAFPLGHPAVVGIAVGAMSGEQAARNARLLDRPIPAGLWREAKESGLLSMGVPVPDGEPG